MPPTLNEQSLAALDDLIRELVAVGWDAAINWDVETYPDLSRGTYPIETHPDPDGEAAFAEALKTAATITQQWLDGEL